jgi:hypothetical protein
MSTLQKWLYLTAWGICWYFTQTTVKKQLESIFFSTFEILGGSLHKYLPVKEEQL